jgi:hypothetical protein
MDPMSLAALATPFVIKGAEAFSNVAGEKLGGKVGDLCQAVVNKFKDDSYAEQTLARVKDKPESGARQGALKEVLAEKMETDSNFAEKMQKLVDDVQKEHPSTVFDQRGQTVHGSQTNIAGNVRGHVFSGSVNMEIDKEAERLRNEMEKLIAPLFSKLGNEFYFHFTPVVLGKDYPDNSSPEMILDVYRFWSGVKENLYLAPNGIQNKIKNFVDLKLDRSRSDGVQKEDWERCLKDLTDAVNMRYNEIK